VSAAEPKTQKRFDPSTVTQPWTLSFNARKKYRRKCRMLLLPELAALRRLVRCGAMSQWEIAKLPDGTPAQSGWYKRDGVSFFSKGYPLLSVRNKLIREAVARLNPPVRAPEDGSATALR
jgi:hypothetical protein